MNVVAQAQPAIVDLSRAYPARYGAPVIARVAVEIFHLRYFTHCMSCKFCGDWCCSFGVDIDVENVARVLKYKDELEARIEVPAAEWFLEEREEHRDYPGGAIVRTNTVEGKCVFLDRRRRGCHLHAFALEKGLDYHDLKPILSTMFPLTFDDGVLHVMDEVDDRTLVCLGEGPTLYRGVRSELDYYFGPAFVSELDDIEARHRDRVNTG
jgi:Fe-S-cluster containining protein